MCVFRAEITHTIGKRNNLDDGESVSESPPSLYYSLCHFDLDLSPSLKIIKISYSGVGLTYFTENVKFNVHLEQW